MLEKIQVSNFAALGQDIDQCKVDALKEQAVNAVEKLEKGTDKGNDFLGWLHLPSSITETELSDIEATAKSLRESCEFVVAIGIGGSYLGAMPPCSSAYMRERHSATAGVMLT